MSKYRFKTKDEFIRDGWWDDEYNVPLGWNEDGDMNHFLGQDVPKELNKECDEGSALKIDWWRFAPTDYTIKEEKGNWSLWYPSKEVNTNGFEYIGDTLMEVSTSGIDWYPRVVFGKKGDRFIVWGCARDIESAKLEFNAIPWKYARRIKTKLTLQEIADKFGLNKDEIEII